MKTFLKIISVCIGMALLVYLEPKFIAFWLCTMGGSLKLSDDLSNFLYLICVILFFSILIVWGIANNNRKSHETKWMPLIIGLSLIICQFIVAGNLDHRYCSPMKANKYGHLRTHGEDGVYGLADKWGNDIVPPYYRYVTDYGDYAKLFRSNGDSIKYDFFEKRFIEYNPNENHNGDNTNLGNSETYKISYSPESKYFPKTFYKVYNDKSQYGIVKKDGDKEKIIVPLKFCSLLSLNEDHELCYFRAKYEKNDHYFDRIYTMDGKLMMDIDGDCEFHLCNWNPAGAEKKNYFCWRIIRDNKAAIFDLLGNCIIPFEKGFRWIDTKSDFYGNNKILYYFIVRKGKYEGLYDYKGEAIIEPDQYSHIWVETYSDGSAYIMFKGDVHPSYPQNLMGKTNNSCYKYNNNPYIYRGENGHSSDNSNNGSGEAKKTQTVHVVRDPIAVNVWIPCSVCGGRGVCQTYGCVNGWNSGTRMECLSCGGSGRCSFCAGQGGHYEVQYQ